MYKYDYVLLYDWGSQLTIYGIRLSFHFYGY